MKAPYIDFFSFFGESKCNTNIKKRSSSGRGKAAAARAKRQEMPSGLGNTKRKRKIKTICAAGGNQTLKQTTQPCEQWQRYIYIYILYRCSYISIVCCRSLFVRKVFNIIYSLNRLQLLGFSRVYGESLCERLLKSCQRSTPDRNPWWSVLKRR